jgi:Ty3 transposon capsid-like protein
MNDTNETPTTVQISTEDLQKIRLMANSFSILQEQLVSLQEQVSKQNMSVNSSSFLPTFPLALQEPIAANPEPFDGTKRLLDLFITQVKLIIQIQPSRFSTDRQKVLFTASFLRGPAAKWFQPLFVQDNPSELLDDFPKFIESLNTAFGGINDTHSAVSLITHLKQSNSVANYAAEFKQLAPYTKWNDEALTYQFYQGLKDNVKDELARCQRPTTLQGLISIATNIDNRIYERITERNYNRPKKHFYPNINHDITPKSIEKMEIDLAKFQHPSKPRKHLTFKERQHRITNKLCLYCGKSDHTINACPLRTPWKNNSNIQISTLSNTSQNSENVNTQY